jgi:hypothetical protein
VSLKGVRMSLTEALINYREKESNDSKIENSSLPSTKKLEEIKNHVEEKPQFDMGTFATTLADKMGLTEDRITHKYSRLNSGEDTLVTVLQRGDNKNFFEILVSPGHEDKIRNLLKEQGIYFQEEIGADPTFAKDSSYDKGTTFKLAPNITSSQREKLNTPANTMDDTKIIVQGEWTKLDYNSVHEKVGTFGVASCKGIVVRNNSTGETRVAHLDMEGSTIAFLKEAIKDLGGDAKQLKIITTDNVDSLVIELLKNNGHDVSTQLPRNFTVDKEGVIGAIPKEKFVNLKNKIPGFSTRLNNLEIRLEHRIDFIEV